MGILFHSVFSFNEYQKPKPNFTFCSPFQALVLTEAEDLALPPALCWTQVQAVKSRPPGPKYYCLILLPLLLLRLLLLFWSLSFWSPHPLKLLFMNLMSGPNSQKISFISGPNIGLKKFIHGSLGVSAVRTLLSLLHSLFSAIVIFFPLKPLWLLWRKYPTQQRIWWHLSIMWKEVQIQRPKPWQGVLFFNASFFLIYLFIIGFCLPLLCIWVFLCAFSGIIAYRK